MAEFGVEATQISPIQNSVPVQAGVERSPVVLEGLNDLAEQVGSIFTARKASAEDGVISDFMVRQTAVIDALEQGTGGITTSAQARSILRRNLMEAVSSNSALASRLAETHNNVLGSVGNRDLVNSGTIEEQRRTDAVNQLVTEGRVAPDANDSEVDQALESRRLAVAAQTRFEERNRTLTLQLQTENLTQAQRDRLEAERKQNALTFAQQSSEESITTLRGQLDTVLSGAGSEAEKLQAIDDIFIGWRSQTNALIGEIGTGEFTAFVKPFEDLRDAYKLRATGELGDAEIKRRTERILEGQRLIAVSDPVIANLAVASNIFSDTIFQNAVFQDPNAFKSALNFMAGGDPTTSVTPTGETIPHPTPFVTTNADKTAMNAYLDSVTRGLASSDPDVQAGHMRRAQSFMESIEDYEGLIRRNPEAGIAIVSWMAKPEFQRALAANPEAFGDLSGVQEVLANHYDNEVWGMIGREFRNNSVEILTGEEREIPRLGVGIMGGATSGTDTRNIVTQGGTPSLVGARSTSAGMEFFPLVTGNDDGAVEARANARRLNRELAPIINTTLKAGAHLNGRTDYGKVWEEQAQTFLGGGMTGNDQGDDLTLESFKEGSSILDQALTTGGFVGNGDYSEAETPAEVAAAFVGFEENQHKNVLSSFIAKAVGIDIDPSKTAWCAAFVNAALGARNAQGTDSLTARSFLEWGQPTEAPTQGDIVVFSRGNSSWQGHVGFYMGEDENGDIKVLGGNQGNKVSVQTYPRSKLLGFRTGAAEGQEAPSFTSEAEAQASLDRGEVAVGDMVMINGQLMRIDEE